MRRLICIVMVAVAGCGGDPATSRLSPGQAVMIYSKDDGHVPVHTGDIADNKGRFVEVGTAATVIDDGYFSDSPERFVRIKVQANPPFVGKVCRDWLRPTK
jgi:hypothetical protein